MSTNHAQGGMQRRRTVEPYEAWDETPDQHDPLQARAYYHGIRLKRVLAYLIDVLIVLALAGAWWLLGVIFSFLTLFLVWPLVVAGAALLPIAYHTYCIGNQWHATLGMRALGIRVAAWNGRDPGYLQGFIQTVLFYATLAGPQIIVLLVSFFNDRGRCLHDILCGTVVINAIDPPSLDGAVRSA